MVKEPSERNQIVNANPLERPDILMAPDKLSHHFPATTAVPRSYLKAGDHISNPITDLGGAKMLNGTMGTVIPDSQDASTQEKAQNVRQPLRRVAQRRHSIAVQPQVQKDKRTITRTEVTEYHVRTSETYQDTSLVQKGAIGLASLVQSAGDAKSADSDTDSSSSLSEPPDDLESQEYLDHYSGENREDFLPLRPSVKRTQAGSENRHSRASPKPNTSRARTTTSIEAIKPGEMKPPKSILKRTKSNINTTEMVSRIHSNVETLRSSETSNVQSAHSGATTNKRLARPKIANKGLDGTLYNSPYNRIVSGTKVSQKNDHFQAPQTPAVDVFAVESSSPAIGQPLRNSKKRVLSRVGMDDDHRTAKLPRLSRH
jgi:hypothetical protein